jgi:hypothetical protein
MRYKFIIDIKNGKRFIKGSLNINKDQAFYNFDKMSSPMDEETLGFFSDLMKIMKEDKQVRKIVIRKEE